jgi:hypothetical protein
MLHSFHKTWTIVEEERFTTELAALMANPVRADEFMEGAIWVLARKPEAGIKLTEDVWILPMLLRNISLFYRFDDNHVYLLSIRSIRSVGDEEEG